ncbi:MAG: PepSY-associated TM helix domain-containing protein [Bryobacteraceae bacterium]
MNSRTLKKWAANGSRWLHIYLSMVSFAIVFFFAATGITLNHPDWFGASIQRTAMHKGSLPADWLREPKKLEVVEALRSRHGVRGALSDFRVEDQQCAVSFKGPGYTADTFVDRATGAYQLTVTTMGLVAVLNDLHKGRDTGKRWAWVIDLSAALLVLVSMTGMILLWFVHKRRVSGYAIALLGLAISYLSYLWSVP